MFIIFFIFFFSLSFFQKILELGGYLARTSVEATHLVMGGNIAPRTVKFMCAISCCQFIVSLQWVIDSHNEARFLRKYRYSYTVICKEFCGV